MIFAIDRAHRSDGHAVHPIAKSTRALNRTYVTRSEPFIKRIITAQIACYLWTSDVIVAARLRSDGRSYAMPYLTRSTWTHLKLPFPIGRS